MPAAYENQRVEFNKILKKYDEYLGLYRFFNNGSDEGATPFDQFYMMHIYVSVYADDFMKQDRGI